MMANAKTEHLAVGPTIKELSDIDKSQMSLLTMMNEENAVFNVNQGMFWVPCAIDSGACANVTPGGMFSLRKTTAKLDPKFFGTGGSPIANSGTLAAQEVSEEGANMNTDFDAANVTRPLLSIFKMTSNGHKVSVDDHGGSILIKGNNENVKLRQEGRLYMLDLWVQVPAELADNSPFIKQVAKI